MWVENLNSLLDETRLLCLANRERIALTDNAVVVFEVDHLLAVSPAMVSRCGIVYVEAAELPWRSLARSYCLKLFGDRELSDGLRRELRRHVFELFDTYLEQGMQFMLDLGASAQFMPVSTLSYMHTFCNIFSSLLAPRHGFEFGSSPVDRVLLNKLFVYSFVWTFGASMVDGPLRSDMEIFVRDIFSRLHDSEIPTTGSVFNIYVSTSSTRFELFDALVPVPHYEPHMHFAGSLIPTVETQRMQYIIKLLLSNGLPTLIGGASGVGKSLVVEAALAAMQLADESYLPAVLHVSPKTTPHRVQRMLEAHLRQNASGSELSVIGAKKLLLFLDNLNVPVPDRFGVQVGAVICMSAARS